MNNYDATNKYMYTTTIITLKGILSYIIFNEF